MNLGIISASFEEGYFHFILKNKFDKIPSIIKWSKHSDRHFIFYNCQIVTVKENNYINQRFTQDINYKYKVSYERKFTSKHKDEVESMFKIYLRDKKLNELL